MLKTTLEQWRMLRAVVEHGGFIPAAQAIHKSQSSVHHAVQKLEESLDVKLVEVIGRKTLLTDAGKMMLRRASYLLDEANKLEAVANTLKQGVETQLKIAVDEVFPQTLLYSVLNKVSAEYPLLRIELMESVLSGANELLESSQVDIAISPFVKADIYNEELCQIDFIAVANPEHALHQINREITLEDLKSYRQIVVRDSAIQSSQDDGWLSAEQRWTVSHIGTSLDMIKKGFGFAWLPCAEVGEALEQGLLKPLNLAHGAKRSSKLYLMFNDADRLGPAARSFIGELRYQCLQLEHDEIKQSD